MKTMEQLRNEVAEQREVLAKAEAELKRREELPEDKQLATELHEIICQWDHTEGCSWYYEKEDGDWERDHTMRAHYDYLMRARKIIAMTDPQTALEIVRIAKDR